RDLAGADDVEGRAAVEDLADRVDGGVGDADRAEVVAREAGRRGGAEGLVLGAPGRADPRAVAGGQGGDRGGAVAGVERGGEAAAAGGDGLATAEDLRLDRAVDLLDLDLDAGGAGLGEELRRARGGGAGGHADVEDAALGVDGPGQPGRAGGAVEG